MQPPNKGLRMKKVGSDSQTDNQVDSQKEGELDVRATVGHGVSQPGRSCSGGTKTTK